MKENHLMHMTMRFVSLLIWGCLANVCVFADDLAVLPGQPVRTWTSSGGKYQVEAMLLEVRDDAVLLKRQDNNKTVAVPLERLSKDDQTYIRQTIGEFVPRISGASITLRDDTTIHFGQTTNQVIAVLGKPQRKEIGMHGLEWHVYNADYSKFVMIAMSNGRVCGLYTNSKAFRCGNGIEYGGTSDDTNIDGIDVTIFRDKDADDTIHAVLLVSGKHKRKVDTTTTKFLAVQSRQCFDATNTFRVNHGLEPCLWDETAAISATRHSCDMATNNYFSHTSLDERTMVDRYAEIQKRSWSACGENISAGNAHGVDAFDDWVNSTGHRENILNESFKYLGIGAGYEAESEYRYYMTQVFITY